MDSAPDYTQQTRGRSANRGRGDEEAFSPEPLSEEDRLKKVFGSEGVPPAPFPFSKNRSSEAESFPLWSAVMFSSRS